MELKKLEEEILKSFDKEFPNTRGIFENGDRYNIRRNAIKRFIKFNVLFRQRQEINKMCEEIIQTERYSGAPHALNEIINKLK